MVTEPEPEPLPATPAASGHSSTAIARGNRRAARLAFVCALACFCYHEWIVTRGWWAWDQSEGYYGLLARAFAHGHTYLDIQPSPALLALPDPYDPAQNKGLRLHDASLYNNRYYLYWGPVPALIVAPLKMLPERWQVNTPDAVLVLALSMGLIFASAALIVRLRERLFPAVPWWTVGIGVLAAGFGHPVPYTMARPDVYEAAIIGGQFFLLSGLLSAFLAFDRHPRWAELGVAGLFWAMATGTRVSLAPTVAMMAGVAMARVVFSYQEVSIRRRVGACAALALPLVAGAVSLAVYNRVRFDAYTDFGTRYMLSAVNSHSLSEVMTSAAYAWPNLIRYLFEWGTALPDFPFLAASASRPEFAARFGLPAEYNMEPVVGIVWFAPFLVLGLIPVVALGRRVVRSDADQERWLTLSLLAGGIVSVAPALLLMGSTMRYQMDGSPCWVLMATMGVCQWSRDNQLAGRRQGVLQAVTGQVLGVSILFGVLLGMSGYLWQMRAANPVLWQWMSHALSGLRL